ncbi:MAG: tetratricopeptide repeat protein [Candidatus Acidiferrales bacterium]
MSVLYRENFNVEFRIVDFESWTPNNVNDLCELTDQLSSLVRPNDPEIALGFTVHTDPTTFGCSQDFTRAVVIPDNGSFSEADIELHIAHELGHLFGGWHLPITNSVMYGFGPTPSHTSFDQFNKQAILLMRNFDFYKGVEGIDGPSVERFTTIYNEGPHFPEVVNPISEAYDRLGNQLAREGNYDEAIIDYRKAVSIDPQNAQAHWNYGVIAERNRQLTSLASTEFLAAATQYLHRADKYVAQENDKGHAWLAICQAAPAASTAQSLDPSNLQAAAILQTLSDRRATICPTCVCPR